jgi:GNAT superfamily N-acetyltransferase
VIRGAQPADRAAVERIVRDAYGIYVERIGKPPGPMLDDYAALIADGAVSVLEDDDGRLAAIIVLLPKPDHLLLDNIAVRPDRQGRGLGRQLAAFAEDEARRLGHAELRLYTHQKMTENIALYTRLGFVETGRGEEAGYDRVFMTKQLPADTCSGPATQIWSAAAIRNSPGSSELSMAWPSRRHQSRPPRSSFTRNPRAASLQAPFVEALQPIPSQ